MNAMGGASPGQTGGAMPNMMGKSGHTGRNASHPPGAIVDLLMCGIGMNMPGGAYNPMMMGMNRMVSPSHPPIPPTLGIPPS
jgi:hypothetical protein